MSSIRKRKFEDTLDSSEGGQEDEGRTCKAAKLDPDDYELPQHEHNPAEVKIPTLRLLHLHHSFLTLVVSSYSRRTIFFDD